VTSQLLRQHSFAGGEVAPEFYGRTHDPRYAISLRTCKNFLPIVHGALVNRPGTFDLGASKTASPRWEAFIFSDTQALLLEFTNLAVRFWTTDGQVLAAGVPYEVATPYVAADLARLNFFQAGDVVTITHPSYQPRDLTRISNTNWTLAVVSTAPPAGFFPTGLALTANGWASDNGTGWNVATVYSMGQYVIASDLRCYMALRASVGDDPTAVAASWALALDVSRPTKEWHYVVTALWKDAAGVKHESLPSADLPITAAIYSDRQLTFHWTAPADPGFPYKLEGYSIYRGRNGVYGWLGDAAGTATSYKDDGQEPDFGLCPPKGTNPFLIADGVNSEATSKWPGCGTYHDQRRVFARSDAKPDTFMGSKVGDIANFDKNDPVQDSDAYEWRVSSQQLEEIRSVKSFGRLLLLTGQGEFSAHGADGAGITPNAVEVRRQSRHGSSYLDPLEVQNVLLFNTSKGNYIRDLLFDLQTESYVGIEVTEFARHLFRGHTIVSWAHQETPYHTVWVVRDDGVLLSLTYDRATQTIAWAQHETQGTVTQVACIPNGTEDALLLAVERNGSSRVELMASRDYVPDVRLACFLDSSLQFDGRNTGAVTMKASGASYNAEDIVTIDASAAEFVGATDLGDQVVIDPDGAEPTRVTITQFNSTTQVLGRLEQPLPAAFQNAATASWGFARDTLIGLDHLNGMTVNALVDGVVAGPFMVTGGEIGPISPPALIATVGLSYTSDAELLDIAGDGARMNVKAVARVEFEVVASVGLYTGEDFDKLRPWKQRKVSDNFGPVPPETGRAEVLIGASWNKGGRAVVRQSDPLPLMITAVTREVEVGGR
jgi:hypothetical protein